MTIRNARQMLFSVRNEELTVKELRNILFDIDMDNDENLSPDQIAKEINLSNINNYMASPTTIPYFTRATSN